MKKYIPVVIYALIVSASIFISDSIFNRPQSTTQDLLDSCEQTWDAGFRMYPDVWEEPEYPYRIECISYPQNKHGKQVWFTHFYNPKTNKLK